MKSTVETLGPTRVRLAIEVPFAELEPSLRKAYREIGAQVSIPGFRKGKVPTAVIDQRVGRGTILSEAVQEAIPEQIIAAVREHAVRTLGPPDVEITEFADGQPLRFTAELDVRPVIELPDLGSIGVTVDAIEVTDEEIAAQVEALRLRFGTLTTAPRPAQVGDFVQIDLAATVDGAEVPGGTATNLSHEVGSNQLLPGLDDALEGMSAGESTTFTTTLVGGDFAGQDADVALTVRTVKERELPELNDAFAEQASEFDTLAELREDVAGRLRKVKKLEQLVTARDKALAAVVEASDIPAPEGVVRDEVNGRKQSMTDQLERIGVTLEDYLSTEGKTEEEFDGEITSLASQAVRVQLLLDAYADTNEVTVTDDEFGHEIVHRAQRAGVNPQQYYDQLIKAGATGAVFSDVRRGKALAGLLERVTITDSAGEPVSLAELTGDDDSGAGNHDHEGHDHD